MPASFLYPIFKGLTKITTKEKEIKGKRGPNAEAPVQDIYTLLNRRSDAFGMSICPASWYTQQTEVAGLDVEACDKRTIYSPTGEDEWAVNQVALARVLPSVGIVATINLVHVASSSKVPDQLTGAIFGSRKFSGCAEATEEPCSYSHPTVLSCLKKIPSMTFLVEEFVIAAATSYFLLTDAKGKGRTEKGKASGKGDTGKTSAKGSGDNSDTHQDDKAYKAPLAVSRHRKPVLVDILGHDMGNDIRWFDRMRRTHSFLCKIAFALERSAANLLPCDPLSLAPDKRRASAAEPKGVASLRAFGLSWPERIYDVSVVEPTSHFIRAQRTSTIHGRLLLTLSLRLPMDGRVVSFEEIAYCKSISAASCILSYVPRHLGCYSYPLPLLLDTIAAQVQKIDSRMFRLNDRDDDNYYDIDPIGLGRGYSRGEFLAQPRKSTLSLEELTLPFSAYYGFKNSHNALGDVIQSLIPFLVVGQRPNAGPLKISSVHPGVVFGELPGLCSEYYLHGDRDVQAEGGTVGEPCLFLADEFASYSLSSLSFLRATELADKLTRLNYPCTIRGGLISCPLLSFEIPITTPIAQSYDYSAAELAILRDRVLLYSVRRYDARATELYLRYIGLPPELYE